MEAEAKNAVCSFLVLVAVLASSIPSGSATSSVRFSPPLRPASTVTSASVAMCPINALKLGACVDVLNGLVHVGVGDPNENRCCAVLGGLVELEAAVCLCTAIKANVLGLNINIPIALNLLITCGNVVPDGFVCK